MKEQAKNEEKKQFFPIKIQGNEVGFQHRD